MGRVIPIGEQLMSAIFSKIDLHTHSTASDGQYTPSKLIQRAIDRGLTHIALTDHDSVLGVEEAMKAAEGKIALIPGAEISTSWKNQQIHIVGLFIDIKSDALTKYLEGQREKRVERAMEIGAKLEKQGFKDPYQTCVNEASPGASITRGNYARYIVKMGRAQSTNEAFDYYLKKGKSCYVATHWPDIQVAVDAIKASGGIPVMAHPRRYDLTNTKLRELLEYFKSCGGEAMEVSSPQMSPSDYDYLCSLCQKYGFMASFGSDFHNEGPYRELGLNLRMKDELTPVWRTKNAEPYHFEN